MVLFIFIQSYYILYANSGYPVQTPRSEASDLGLHCLPMSHKKDSRLIWVNISSCYCGSYSPDHYE